MTDLAVADVLDKAADHIEEVGWWQGDYAPEIYRYQGDLNDCPVCLLGAINWAATGNPFNERALTTRHAVAEKSICNYIGANDPSFDYYDLPHAWNDAPGRTQAEVVAALRGAAAQVRAS